MATTKFRSLSNVAFNRKYPEAMDNAGGPDCNVDLGSSECTGFGEVKIEGKGWCGCVLGLNAEPIFAYTEKEGWHPTTTQRHGARGPFGPRRRFWCKSRMI
jgi:hypothetical protein